MNPKLTYEFSLGQKVRFKNPLKRRWESPNTKKWVTDVWDSAYRNGVVVGKRTLSNGTVSSGYDGSEYMPKETFSALIISFDMHRKPVKVRIEDVEPIDG